MTIAPINRATFELPGDVIARPHANCYWLVPGRVLAGEHPGAITAAEVPNRVGALLGGGRPHRNGRRVPAARARTHDGRGAWCHRPQVASHGKEGPASEIAGAPWAVRVHRAVGRDAATRRKPVTGALCRSQPART